MTELILLGGGGHCESVIEVIHSMVKFSIKGILDPTYDHNVPKEVLGYPIIGNDNQIESFIKEGCQFVITVGQIGSSNLREKLFEKVINKGGEFPKIIASTAYVSKRANIAVGTVIHHNAFVNANANLGNCCIVNSGCIIEHGCLVGDFCHISTGAILNGEVNCGKGVFVGSGSVVNQGIKIGERMVIASGSLVRRNIEEGEIYAGNPIRKIR